jgi:glucose-1-phosphatase
MIKAVIFDVGGVLIRTDDPAPRQRLEQRLGLSAGQAEFLVFNSPVGMQAQRGEIPFSAVWQWVRQELGLDATGLEAFRQEFLGGDRLDTGLVEYIRRLRSHYQTAILSNNNDTLREMLVNDYPMADAFDLIVCSADEGIMKPDPAIYLLTLERLGRAPAEAIFVDDAPHNVTAARAVGLHSIHYTPGLDLPAAMAVLGVVV